MAHPISVRTLPLVDDHVIVEFHEDLTVPIGGLALHVIHPRGEGSVAWWMDDRGRFFVRVPVGLG
jgi:hypothetical protein